MIGFGPNQDQGLIAQHFRDALLNTLSKTMNKDVVFKIKPPT